MKKRGRPGLDPSGPSTPVHVKLRASDYDAADRLAKQSRETVPAVIRRGLRRLLDDTPPR